MTVRNVFVTGGTGFVGRHLLPELVDRGHRVNAVAQPESLKKLPHTVNAIAGDVLSAESYAAHLEGCDTFVQLTGVTHPSPSKAAEFRSLDLESARQAVHAAERAGIRNFVYISVAQPSPVMKAYVAVRQECEALITQSGLNASILRPFYVLGPGRQWPRLLQPFFWLAKRLPSVKDTAGRLSFVTLRQMTGALVEAIEHPPQGIRIWSAAEIREHGDSEQKQFAAA